MSFKNDSRWAACLFGLIAVAVSGCASAPLTPPPEHANGLGSLFYVAAEQLALRSATGIAKDRPVLVATMVSVDDLEKSASFGKLASQMIVSRLVQQGFYVRDITYMRAFSVSPGSGEIVLSRDATQISATLNAQAVIAGTFAVAGSEIWLNVRLLRAEDGAILSSVDVQVPLDYNTRPLLTALR